MIHVQSKRRVHTCHLIKTILKQSGSNSKKKYLNTQLVSNGNVVMRFSNIISINYVKKNKYISEF